MNIRMRQKRHVAVVLGVFAAVALLVVSTSMLANSRTFQLFGEVVPRVDTSERVVALTFDDGPTPEAAEEVLSILRERSVKATFFVVGEALKQHAEWGRRMAQEGHELGNHTYSHKRMVFKTPSFIREEVESTDLLIRATGYQGPVYFRPPYGKKLALLPYYLSRTDRKNIMWDVAPESDPDVARDADKLIAHVLSEVRPGSIILLHVMYKSGAPSLRALPGIIDGLRRQGYEFRTISELLSKR